MGSHWVGVPSFARMPGSYDTAGTRRERLLTGVQVI